MTSKRLPTCSVENPESNNHYVMCYGSQHGLAALALVFPRTQCGSQSPLDHRVDRFHLPALPILLFVPTEPLLHPSPPAARRWLVRRPPARWRDDSANAMRPDAAMNPFGVEVRVGQKRPDPSTADGLLQRRIELHQVRARSSTGYCRQDHVAGAIDHEDDLGELGVSRDLVAVPAVRAALDVVPAGMSRLQPGAVDGSQRDASLADSVPQRPLEHRVEQPAGWRGQEQSPGGLLEGGEVRHGFHPDLSGDIRVIHEVLGEAAVVERKNSLSTKQASNWG